MRTALITGASRGIGAAIASQMALDGYNVITPSRTDMDLSSNESIQNYLLTLTTDIDILVNDAGINKVSSIDEIKLEDIYNTLQINLIAAFQLTQHLIQGMKGREFGRIVNISSIWSKVARPGRVSYAMSKTALNGMTRSLAVELAPSNILVNAVAPGYVLTDLTIQNNSPDDLKTIAKAIPLQRLATPLEIAKLVSFLCSENNTYVTGQVIVADGGYSCV